MSTKFPTETEIYNRLRSDSNFLPHLAILAYVDKIKGKSIELPLTQFVPIDKGGKIPLNRITHFKYDGKVIWDRANKVCLIDEVHATQGETILIEEGLKVMTYNVLNDKHLKLGPQKALARLNEINAFLLGSGADLICLQEVSPEHQRLLQSPEIQRVYPYSAVTDLADDNLVILSKLTIFQSESLSYGHSEHKRALIITLHDQVYNLPIAVIGVHLTSNHQSHAEQKRREQLRLIQKYLKNHAISHYLILGDFNGEVTEDNLGLNAIQDPYVTYDPTHNTYAKMMSTSGLALPLDKVFIHSPLLKAINSKIYTQIPLSDHYPLWVSLSVTNKVIEDQGSEVDTSTALCIIIPPESWSAINEIRQRQDPAYGKWMPHITLAHGFLAKDNLSTFLETDLGLSPFTVRLNAIGKFTHDKKETYYLEPETQSKEALISAHQQLRLLMPEVFSEDYNPHVTLGYNPVKATFDLTFEVTRLHVLHKAQGSEYYRVIHQVPLIKDPLEPPSPTTIIDRLRSWDPLIKWEIGGSGVFSLENLSDLDLVAFGTEDKGAFFASLRKYLETCGDFFMTSLVITPHGSYIKTNYGLRLAIDIHYVPKTEAIATSLSVYTESRKILESVPDPNLFLKGLRQIKALARKAEVYGSNTGFPPGIAWAILVAHFCQVRGPEIEENFVAKFCEYYANYDYDRPITLNGQSYKRSSEDNAFADRLMMIVTSTEPQMNTIRTITPLTKAILLNEFRTGLTGQSLKTRRKVILELSAHQSQYEAIYGAQTLLNEKLPKLLIKLNRKVPNLRPFSISEIQRKGSELRMSWSLGYEDDSTFVHLYTDRLAKELGVTFVDLAVRTSLC